MIDVGYNDAPSGFAAGIDRVMRALLDAGVDQVVWITLRERRPSWAEINDQIREARKRWPQLTVGDWELESRDHDGWFADGIHMNWNGGEAFGASSGRSSSMRAAPRAATAARCSPSAARFARAR